MNACANETALQWHTAAIAIWDNEDGARGRNSTHHQYGRRIEADNSWSIYHVFTGVPAHIGGFTMTGLSRSAATSGMMALNRHNEGRRPERSRLTEGGSSTGEIDEVRS